MCFCGEPLKNINQPWKACNCCCRQWTENAPEFYNCFTFNQCKYVQISTAHYMVCEECYNSQDYGFKDSNNDFIFNKTKLNMKIIS